MSNETDHITARVANGVSKEITRYQKRQPEGYSRSKAVEDLIAAGAEAVNGPPKWIRTLTSAAHLAAISTMVSGMFALAGMATPPILAFCAASAGVMVLTGGARLLYARRRGFQ